MSNKLIKRRYNNLLISRNKYFDDGGGLDWSNPFKGANGTSALNSLVGAAGSAVGQIGGGLIGGGLQSGAGSVLQGLSGIASAIPGPWGAVASAGLGVLSGITNKFVGSKMNEENIAKVEANINKLNSFQSNASDFDALASNWANADVGMTFDDSFIGKDGLLVNKARNKAVDLRNKVAAGNAWVQNTLVNNAENISNTQIQNLLANYAAYGGPLLFADGGSIHIKPENRGKFTATKKRTGKTTEELTHSKNPLTRKRAIFAQNAKKWHHAFGGDLFTHGSNFDTGLTLIGNGGTHEENPLEGVPMGVDSEGIPNLVEEGEVIFNDYVFSKRLKVPKEVRKKYKLRGIKPLTFADAAIQMSKESEERPNDPISQAGLEDSMTKLMIAQEVLREKSSKGRKFARGGRMGRIYEGEIGDPYPQILDLGMGPINPDSMWAFNPEVSTPQKAKTTNNRGIVLGGATANPTIIKPGESTIQDIIGIQENKYPSPKPDNEEALDLTKDDGEYPNYDNTLRYMPVIGSMIGLGTSLFTKPDDGDAQAILEASSGKDTYRPVRYRPVGNYLTYRPFDRDYYINKMNAEAGASRRALMNTSGGNRATAMAGILASDNNYLNQLGALARQAEEYNLAQRNQVEEFNRGTNIQNSEGFLKADIANQSALANARDLTLRGTMAAADIRSRARLAREQAISDNLSNIFSSLGDIGKEKVDRMWRTWASKHGVYAPVKSDKEKANGGKIKRKKRGLTF